METTPLTGGCVCGDIRYQCTASPSLMANCHCRDCQRITGGPYAPIVVVLLEAFRVTIGSLKRFATTRLNGRQNLRGFCARCGSHLTVGEDPARNAVGILASTFDDPSWFKPAMDIFISDAPSWVLLDAGIPKHQQYAPRR